MKKIGIIIKIFKKFKDSQHPPIITNRESQEGKVGSLMWFDSLTVNIVNEMDRQLDQKIEKRRFFQDIQNSFQWVTGIGLKMPQFFSF